jgi:hypothetical protein
MFNAEPHGVSNTQFPAKNVRHHHRRRRYRIGRVGARCLDCEQKQNGAAR